MPLVGQVVVVVRVVRLVAAVAVVAGALTASVVIAPPSVETMAPSVGAIGPRCEHLRSPAESGAVAIKTTCPQHYVSFSVVSATGEQLCVRTYPLPMVPGPTFETCGIGD